jgi:predicted DNA-binding antitoxin AbrB/MazE fold protein
MIAFRIDLNGKQVCVAGVGQHGTLTTFVNYVSHNRRSMLDLAVSGLYTATEEHAIWKKVDLKAGDKVQVTVIETNSVDKPKIRYRPDSKTAERNQKAYVRAWAKKFGWKIVVQPKKSK